MTFTVIMAAIAMVVADVLSVLLVQAEARNKAHLAGLLDTLAWGAGIAVTFITVTALGGHSLKEKVAVVLAVSAANYVGTVVGTLIGKRFVKEDATTLADRIKRLEDVVLRPFDK